jgi:hypothetical protein
MKLYRFIARYAGQRIIIDVKAHNDDEAKVNFINGLKQGGGTWRDENMYSPSKVFITYEEINDDRNVTVSVTKKDQLGIQVEPILS